MTAVELARMVPFGASLGFETQRLEREAWDLLAAAAALDTQGSASRRVGSDPVLQLRWAYALLGVRQLTGYKSEAVAVAPLAVSPPPSEEPWEARFGQAKAAVAAARR